MRFFLLAILSICVLETGRISDSISVYKLCLDGYEYVVISKTNGGTGATQSFETISGVPKQCKCDENKKK